MAVQVRVDSACDWGRDFYDGHQPSLLSFKWSRGGTHVPGRRPCRASCWRSQPGHPPERGVPRFGPTAPVDTHLTNPAATTSQTRPQEPLKVATRTNALVDHQPHNPSLTGSYGVVLRAHDRALLRQRCRVAFAWLVISGEASRSCSQMARLPYAGA